MKKHDLVPPFEAYNGDSPFLFVSYAHKDANSVFPEITYLHEQGYRIWYDEGIDPGNEWPEEIGKALSLCSFFIVFISSNAVSSQNVRNEINFALNKTKPFLAIHIEDTSLPTGLELRMGDIQAILKYRMSEENYCRKLSKTIPSSLKSATFVPENEVRSIQIRQIVTSLKRIVSVGEAWRFGEFYMWLSDYSNLLIAHCVVDFDKIPPVALKKIETLTWKPLRNPYIFLSYTDDDQLNEIATKLIDANRIILPEVPISKISIFIAEKPTYEPPWHIFSHMGHGDVDFICKQCGYADFNLSHYDIIRDVPQECPQCSLGRGMPKDNRRY
jgi:hypothetical protein